MHQHNQSASICHELASLIARVLYRQLRCPQNLPPPPQDCLATPPETLLSVTTTVNNPGDTGEA
ncbi:MAG TPA: hypothetical protein PKA06_03940 [Gemmatales bacterium]|nr:hypothetical protein [Gemmatales bacterium]